MSLGTTVAHAGRSHMKQQASEAFAAFVGLDWADTKHDVCLQATGTEQREFLRLEHSPEAINAWVQTLRTRFNGQPVAVCLELNKGPIVSALRNYEFLVLFPVNPLTVAKYREAFTPSRAKDDPTDAELQVEILLKHRDKLTPLSPQSPTMRALAQLVEHRRRLVGDKVRLTNRLTSALKNYFPHVLQWFQEKDTAIFCDFLSRWPTLKAVQLARRATLESFLRAHHVRPADVITTRIEAIKNAVAVATSEGVIAPPRGRRRTTGSLPLRRGTPKICGHRTGHRAPWQEILGPLALAVSDVPPTNVRGMGRRIAPAFLLGTSL